MSCRMLKLPYTNVSYVPYDPPWLFVALYGLPILWHPMVSYGYLRALWPFWLYFGHLMPFQN